METRLLILNSDPVFQDRVLAALGLIDQTELRIVRTLAEAVQVLLEENFNLFLLEGELDVAVEQATRTRQHFPSLRIVCLTPGQAGTRHLAAAAHQKFTLLRNDRAMPYLTGRLRAIVREVAPLEARSASEGIDPLHSLIGNLNQFSAAEILQMSCLSQRTGRFTFKSGRGNSEVYLQHGCIRHAAYGPLEGESALAEVFRWRQGRFFFEEGIISQVGTVDRPWAHLLIDNLQKLDETMELVGSSSLS